MVQGVTRGSGQQRESRPDHDAGERSHNGYQELRPRVGRFFLDHRDAAQGEERDPPHRQVTRAGNQRVRELMRQQTGEKENGGQNRRAPYDLLAPVPVGLPETLGQRHSNENGDDEPAIVQPDFNAEDASELDL